MNPFLSFIGSVVSAIFPGTVAYLAIILFAWSQMQPLSWWDFPVQPFAFLACLVGSTTAKFFPRRNATNYRKVFHLIIAAVLFFVSVILYQLQTRRPPTIDNQTIYEIIAYGLFFPIYLLMGYCFGLISSFLLLKGDDKK